MEQTDWQVQAEGNALLAQSALNQLQQAYVEVAALRRRVEALEAAGVPVDKPEKSVRPAHATARTGDAA